MTAPLDPKVREVVRAAVAVALDAPLRRGAGGYAVSAQVSWAAITDLRGALEAVGIDWRAHHRANRAVADHDQAAADRQADR